MLKSFIQLDNLVACLMLLQLPTGTRICQKLFAVRAISSQQASQKTLNNFLELCDSFSRFETCFYSKLKAECSRYSSRFPGSKVAAKMQPKPYVYL